MAHCIFLRRLEKEVDNLVNYDDLYFDKVDKKLLERVKEELMKLGVSESESIKEIHLSGFKRVLEEEPVYTHWKGEVYWVEKIINSLSSRDK